MIKIFPCETMKELDEYTIEHEPISSVDLMERAAAAFTEAVVAKWNNETPVTVFAGPGNNGGDALAVARMLSEKGYKVEVYLFNVKGALSPDCLFNKELLETIPAVTLTEVSSQFVPPSLTEAHLIIDGLFGTGLSRPLEGGFAAVVKYINASPGTVVAIDMPSGLMGEDNSETPPNRVIKADYTFSFQLPKLAFFFAENNPYVGCWSLLNIGISQEGIDETDADFYLTEIDDIASCIKKRDKFAHKGNFGHALLIAGSRGMAGASVLSARACLNSGVGLLTVHAPAHNTDILQIAVPEAMVESDIHEDCFAYPTETEKYQAVAIGPGLGQSAETEAALFEQIATCHCPMVIDADGINLLAKNKQALKALPQGSILTPHPKELERIVGPCENSFQRLIKAGALAQLLGIHIVVKGAYTAVAAPGEVYYFNSTGNPGMATAGSGDVLTGVILALLAQGYTSEKAAKIGVFAHGMAGDMACEKYGEIALNAEHIIEFLPQAWKALKAYKAS